MTYCLKYSKLNLLELIYFLKNDIFVFFYDLEPDYFDEVVSRFRQCMDNLEKIIVQKRGECFLVITGTLKFQKVQILINTIEKFDISDVAICESKPDKKFDEEVVFSSKKYLFGRKLISVWKDEMWITYSNFPKKIHWNDEFCGP